MIRIRLSSVPLQILGPRFDITVKSEPDESASHSGDVDFPSWNRAELNLREAVCLFRICTNPVRRPRPDWHRNLEAGLR